MDTPRPIAATTESIVCRVCLTCSPTFRSDYCQQCLTIVTAAIDAISVARRIGVAKYNAETWREQGVGTHLEHASQHVTLNIYGVETDEDDLAHAICRLAMARVLENES